MQAHIPNPLTWPTRLSQSKLRVVVDIPGDPISKQRPRFCVNKNGKVYTPKHTVEAEQEIAWAIKAAHNRIVEDPDTMFGVRAIFICKSYQRRDLDNMTKLVFDACNGLVWKDDAQVVEMNCAVLRGEAEPYTRLVIYSLGVTHRPEVKCRMCGKTFRTYRSWKLRGFCSRECCAASLRTGIMQKCSGCDKRIYWAPFRSVGKKRHYCSAACFTKDTTVILRCAQCATEFSRPKSLHRHPKARPFCSESCLAEHRRNRAKLTSYGTGTCSECGGTTSKAKYLRCSACNTLTRGFRSPGRKPKLVAGTEPASPVVP